MRPYLIVLACILLSPLAVAEISVVDAMGRKIVLPEAAQRVVSLAPHITEVVFAAGAGEQLVGAVSYSDYPEVAKSIPRVGSYDSISYTSEDDSSN